MKRIFTIASALLMTSSLWAQAPEKMSYQAVVRDASDALVATQTVGMQISILQTTATGTAVYTETHTPTTNANGLATLEIGTGTVVSGDFTTIDWANDTYFIKTETDPTGGTNYTISGTSQLMSVPYALHAKTADSITGGVNITETDPVFGASIAIGITAADTANWNNHTVDTDTQIDSTGIAALGFVAGSQDLSSVLTEGDDAAGNDMLNIGTLGVGTSTPNAGAAVEISSTTGALLLPRMTTTQRDAISTPERGMMIFNTEVKKFQGYVADSTQNYDVTSAFGFPQQTATTSCLGGPGQSFQADFMTTNWAILEVEACSNTQGTFTLNIYDGEGMGGTLLLTQDVYLTDGINQIALLTPLTLVPGQQYTFTFGTGPGLSYTSNTASYPNGTAYNVTTPWAGDLYFKILDGNVQYNDWVDLH